MKAAETQSQGVMWQRRQTHFTCSILDASPKELQAELHSQLRVIWEAPEKETAWRMLQRVINGFGKRAPRAVNILEDDLRTRSRGVRRVLRISRRRAFYGKERT